MNRSETEFEQLRISGTDFKNIKVIERNNYKYIAINMPKLYVKSQTRPNVVCQTKDS